MLGKRGGRWGEKGAFRDLLGRVFDHFGAIFGVSVTVFDRFGAVFDLFVTEIEPRNSRNARTGGAAATGQG
jgi:hypothetical protein